MADKWMTTLWTSVVTSGMQMKPTMRCPLMSPRLWSKKQKISWRLCALTGPSHTAGGNLNGTATVCNSLAVPPRVRLRVSIQSNNSSPKYIPERTENTRAYKNLSTNVHSSIISNRQSVGITQISVGKCTYTYGISIQGNVIHPLKGMKHGSMQPHGRTLKTSC